VAKKLDQLRTLMPRQNRSSAGRRRAGQSRSRRNQPRGRRSTSARRGARQTGIRASRSVRARRSGAKRTTRSRGGARTRAQAGRRGSQGRRTQTRASGRTTTDHDEIQQWVEERGGWPATVFRSARGREGGILRIDFPGYSGQGTLNPISWDEWFRVFDENNLAFLYQERAAGGGLSRFFKLVER
jgi:hypothetical protein